MSLASACSGSIKEVHCKLNVINAEIKWALVISPHSLKAILFLFFKKIPLNFKHNIIGKLHPSGISNWRCPINTLLKKKHSSSLFFHAISMFKFTPQNFTSWLCTCECTAVPNYYKSDQHQRENILNSRFHRFTRQSAARNWTVERNTCCWLKSMETAKPLWWASRFFLYFFTYITWCSALYKN